MATTVVSSPARVTPTTASTNLNHPSSHQLALAAHQLRRGGVIAYPTEAVWGLGCDPRNAEAVERLLALKQRPPAKGLILVAASIDQVQPWLRHLDPDQRRRLHEGWPGPLTWIVPNAHIAPAWVTGGRPDVALRVSAHPGVRALCEAFGGPVVSTSANPSGRPPARSPLQLRRYFAGRLDYVLPGELGGAARPTEIRHLQGNAVLRAG